MADPATFAAVFVALYVAHDVSDHWLQTHTQAVGKDATSKAGAGWTGRLACGRHVLTLTLAQAASLGLLIAHFGLKLQPGWVAAGLALNAVTHYIADRRTPLFAIADALGRRLIPGKGTFARLGDPAAAPTGTGAYALDQSWHLGWLFAAAILTTL